MEIGADSILRVHQTDNTQLFIIIKRNGWTKIDTSSQILINENCYVFWNKGE